MLTEKSLLNPFTSLRTLLMTLGMSERPKWLIWLGEIDSKLKTSTKVSSNGCNASKMVGNFVLKIANSESVNGVQQDQGPSNGASTETIFNQ